MTVVDASVWVSRSIVSDVNHAASSTWLARHLAGGGLIIAPTILLAEVAGALARKLGDPQPAQRVIQLLLRMPALRLVPVDRQLGESSARLAADLRLRGADAVYVATAQRLSVPLVTWDAEQRARASPVIVTRYP